MSKIEINHSAFDEVYLRKDLYINPEIFDNLEKIDDILDELIPAIEYKSNEGNYSILEFSCLCMQYRLCKEFNPHGELTIKDNRFFRSSIWQFTFFVHEILEKIHKQGWLCNSIKISRMIDKDKRDVSINKTFGNIFEIFIQYFAKKFPNSILGIDKMKYYPDEEDHGLDLSGISKEKRFVGMQIKARTHNLFGAKDKDNFLSALDIKSYERSAYDYARDFFNKKNITSEDYMLIIVTNLPASNILAKTAKNEYVWSDHDLKFEKKWIDDELRVIGQEFFDNIDAFRMNSEFFWDEMLGDFLEYSENI